MQDSFAKVGLTHLREKISVTREAIDKNGNIIQLRDYPLIQIQKQMDPQQRPKDNLNELRRTEAFRDSIL